MRDRAHEMHDLASAGGGAVEIVPTIGRERQAPFEREGLEKTIEQFAGLLPDCHCSSCSSCAPCLNPCRLFPSASIDA